MKTIIRHPNPCGIATTLQQEFATILQRMTSLLHVIPINNVLGDYETSNHCIYMMQLQKLVFSFKIMNKETLMLS